MTKSLFEDVQPRSVTKVRKKSTRKKVVPKSDIPVRGCRLCSLGKRDLQVFDVDGPWDAEVVFVGEAPGQEEEKTRKVFVGKTGKLLRRVLEDLGISNYLLTNVCCCRHPDRPPTPSEIKKCSRLLKERIQRIQPRLIVPLGNTAIKALLFLEGVTKWRGKFVNKGDFTYLPTFHPAAILRDQDKMDVFLTDLNRVKDFLDGKIPGQIPTDYRMVSTLEDFHALISYLREKKRFSFDLETTSLKPWLEGSEILIATFSAEVGKVSMVPFEHPETPFSRIELDEVIYPALDALCEDSSLEKILQNGMFDIGYLEYLRGIRFRGFSFCTLLAHYLQDERKGTHKLEQLAWAETDLAGYDLELREYVSLHPEADFKKGGNYRNIPLAVLSRYGMGDADVTFRLEQCYAPRLEKEGFRDLFDKILVPSSYVLSKVRRNGLRVDVPYTKTLITEYEKELEAIELRLHTGFEEVATLEKVTDEPLNFGSPAQLRFLLFEILGLPVRRRTPKTKEPSTDHDTLEALKHYHPVVAEILNYRKKAKLLSTYLTPVESWLAQDGRAHPDYLPFGTVTGRLACSDPNLQNIPRKSDIKNIFIPEDGLIFLEMDFSQLELRIMAMLSGDERLVQAFIDGRDIHRATAAAIFQILEEEVTEDQRFKAKGINFGLIYGREAESLAQEFGMQVAEAVEFKRKYFQTFPGVARFIKSVKEAAAILGYVKNLFGRRRRLPQAQSTNNRVREAALRQAVNAPIQAFGSDLTLYAMVIIDEILEEQKMQTKIVTEVHDSLLFELPPGEKEPLMRICKGVAEHLPLPKDADISWVPLVVDMKVGIRWGSLEKVT